MRSGFFKFIDLIYLWILVMRLRVIFLDLGLVLGIDFEIFLVVEVLWVLFWVGCFKGCVVILFVGIDDFRLLDVGLFVCKLKCVGI